MSLKQSSTTMVVYSLTQVVYHSSEIGIGASGVFKKFTGRRPVIVLHETVHFLVNMRDAEWKWIEMDAQIRINSFIQNKTNTQKYI